MLQLTPDEIAHCCPPLPPWGLDAADGPVPLQAVEVSGSVTGLNAALTLTQTFRNDRDTPIEAVYTFPLPDHVAVTGLTAWLGDREITARIDERQQARADYEQALADGKRAALLEQERGDIFTAQLGNLPPGEEARIVLHLAGRLGVDSGEATLRLPLLVGDRYVPGTPLAQDPAGVGVRPDTDQVPDASRISPPRRPGPTGVRLAVDLQIHAGGLITGAPRVSPTLTVAETDDGWRLGVTAGADLDRDLVARFGVRPSEASATAFLSADADDPTAGTWQVVVAPPAREATAGARRVVLALDRSGSMNGWKMVAARRAAARIVDSLGAEDSFCVLGFDHVVEEPPEQRGLVTATDRERYAAVRWLSGLDARGGTELAMPLRRAAEALRGTEGEKILVLLTDGQVGNEAELLRLMAQELRGVRIYALGIDHAVNATFLRRLAAVGGGRCDLVESEHELDRVLTALHRRIAPPLARGVAVAMDGVRLDRAATTPALADVFAAGPTVVQGRWHSSAPLDARAVSVTVLAETDSGVAEWPAPVTLVEDRVDTLRNTWARARLDAMADDLATMQGRTTPEQITEFSLAHQVLSEFTAWLAIGPGGVQGPLVTVPQPVAQHQESFVAGGVSTGYLPGGIATRAMAAPAPAAAMSYQHMADIADVGGLDLTPFADRLADLLTRCERGGDPALAREIAELVSDLESVGAPEDLVRAIAGLPAGVAEVRRLWAEVTA